MGLIDLSRTFFMKVPPQCREPAPGELAVSKIISGLSWSIIPSTSPRRSWAFFAASTSAISLAIQRIGSLPATDR